MNKDRIGETNVNNKGEKMTIIEYKSSSNIIVSFINELGVSEVNTSYQWFKRGSVKNPLCRSVYGVGYLGVGKYKTVNNGEVSTQYVAWKHMMARCYCLKHLEKRPSYIGCSVNKNWHNFQVFAKWYDENYYEVQNDKMHLDKDILIKGNKLYSPETCIFVPRNINLLFLSKHNKRGKYPIGTYVDKRVGKFIVNCKNQLIEKSIYLGAFDNIDMAFDAYKLYKENHIREVADFYKDGIPTKLYKAMYSYKIEVTD